MSTIDLGDNPVGSTPTDEQKTQLRSSLGLGSTDTVEFGTLALQSSITAEQVDFLVFSPNLFDKNAAVQGLMTPNGNLSSTNTTYFTSDFIEVEAGETYRVEGNPSGARFHAAFDSNFTAVTSAGSTTTTSTITIPASGVSYIKFSGNMSQIDAYQFEKGTEITEYTAFGTRLASNILLSGAPLLADNYSNKKLTSYGDSVTSQNTWQSPMIEHFGFNATNLGVGGRRLSGASVGMVMQSNVDTIPTDTDVLIVMGGVNDWAQSIVLGTEDSTNEDEFYGGLNVITERLINRLPDTCRIIYATPTYSDFLAQGATDRGWPNVSTNNAGLTTHDYAEAVRVVAKKNGIPVLDAAAGEGTNAYNIDSFRKDDGGRLHPNEAGGIRIGEIGIGLLTSIAPLS